MAKQIIEEIILEITNQCNMRCRICNIWREKPRMIGYDALKGFLESVLSRHKVKCVSLTGGEPFLHPDFGKILRFVFALKKKGLIGSFDINTNGYATQMIKKILKKNADFLYGCHFGVSLDGVGLGHSLARRRPRAFEKTLSTVEFIKSAFGRTAICKIKFTLSKFNYSEIYDCYRLCRDRGLIFSPKMSEENVANYYHRHKTPGVLFDPLAQKKTRVAIEKQLEMILTQELKRARRSVDVKAFRLLLYLVKRGKLRRGGYSCLTPLKCLFLTSDAKVYSCLYSKEIGTLRNPPTYLFSGKHKSLIAKGARGDCPGCYASHGLLKSFNRPIIPS